MLSPFARRSALAPVLLGLALWASGAGTSAAQDDSPATLEAPATDEPPATTPDRRRIAVLILPASPEVDPAMADGLSELLVGALAARGGVTIVGKEEFQAQLGQGDAGTLECISSMACLGRVGVQLDVVEVIAGTLAHREGRWVFNLNRVDVPRGEIAGRVFREVEGDLGAVADALNAAIPELYAPPAPPEPDVPPAPPEPAPGTLVLACAVEGAEVSVDGALVGHTSAGGLRHELPPGSFDVRVAARGHHLWRRSVRVIAGREVTIAAELEPAYEESPSPLLWIGLGVAAASFGAGLGLGVHSQETLDFTDAQRASGDVLRAELVSFYESREREAIAADVLFAIAGAAAIAAFVAAFFPDRRRRDDVVAILPAPGGLVVRGAL